MLTILKSANLGYYAVLILAVLATGGLWLWSSLSDAYDRGENACKAEFAQASAQSEKKSKQGADNVRKKISRLDDIALDAELCRLGIVQQDSGCQ